MTTPTINFDRKTTIWVGCHNDQNGDPLVCVEIAGQIVPIATAADMAGLIERSGALASSYDTFEGDIAEFAAA